MHLCKQCGDEVHPQRWLAGYKLCLLCGEEHARQERASWCVVQQYGKGGYQFVTAQAARQVLIDTNQKSIRS